MKPQAKPRRPGSLIGGFMLLTTSLIFIGAGLDVADRQIQHNMAFFAGAYIMAGLCLLRGRLP